MNTSFVHVNIFNTWQNKIYDNNYKLMHTSYYYSEL